MKKVPNGDDSTAPESARQSEIRNPKSEIRNTAVVLLAAGKGTRMISARPKLLHDLAGRPLGVWIVGTALALRPGRLVVVVGHGREEFEAAVRSRFPGAPVSFALQREQLGTGHALRCGLARVPRSARRVLVLYGDTPLVPVGLLRTLAARPRRRAAPLAMVVSTLDDPAVYGRIVRDASGRVVRIVEHRDASPAERAIREVNPGIYSFDAAFLRRAVRRLGRRNAQGEFYLTDLVALAAAEGGVCDVAAPFDDLAGVNMREDLAALEERCTDRIRRGWMLRGVTIRAPATVRIEAEAVLAPDVEIGPGAQILGRTRVGRGSSIGAGSILRDVDVGMNVEILPYVVAEGSTIADGARVGPFARVRPGTEVGRDVHLGNFVETKKTVLLEGAKANHLAYLGDGVIGRRTNVGAGTIFCNYDGRAKHRTVLGDDVFVGSDSQLVAPVTVGDGAYIASGSTVTDDVPPDALAVARARQVNKPGYMRRLRDRTRRGAGGA